MDKNILVLAYPGSGKTYIADNYENVSDFEFQHYRYDYGKYKDLPLEQLKGRTKIRTLKPEWPNNFFDALKEELNKRKLVMVPFATSILKVLPELEKHTRIILAIPTKECFEQIIEVYKIRNNNEEFITRRQNDFNKHYEIITQSKYEKVYIEKNEYLYDALLKLGVSFEKGKGFKNYI